MTAAARPTHLLLVDDDPLLRGMAVKALRHSGFAVSDCGSGEDALACFGAQPFDLVLLDVMMPGLDGFAVCRSLRATAQGARVPILMLTGLDDTESIERAYASGATDFITKPINWTLLSHRVRYALRASIAAEGMRASREALARAQRMAGMGNWQRLADGRMDCSEQLMALYGAAQQEHSGVTEQSLLGRVPPADRERLLAARARLAQDGTAYQLEFQIEGFDGTLRTVFEQANRMLDAASEPVGIEGITQDITARVEASEQIRLLANYDSVTGLPNQHFFAELAAAPIARARRNGSMCALVHIDIDRFKGVNDAFGRAQGDAVLQTIAERLRSWTRSGDQAAVGREQGRHGVLARVGSNAFTLLMADVAGQEPAGAVANRLMAAIVQPIEVQNQSLLLTASVGIALFPTDAPDLAGLARCAEQAVYAAKAGGRAQHRFFDEQLNAHAANRLLLESDLRRGIARGELRLHFQPKVDVSTGRIAGAEALVRWEHPFRGLVGPNQFIALAEETGLILPLTDWVLEAACTHLRAWTDAGLADLPLSVNLAASSLADPDLVAKLDLLVGRFDLAPNRLTLEVTESMLMRDVEQAITLLQTLRERGFGLSLDDFGTGYSSLSYLKRLTMDELKIDRSFVIDCAAGGRDGALAVAIIALGIELGLQVVAEGVETPEQSAFLLRQGCRVQQGYLYARPVPDAVYQGMLRRGSTAAAPAPSAAAAT